MTAGRRKHLHTDHVPDMTAGVVAEPRRTERSLPLMAAPVAKADYTPRTVQTQAVRPAVADCWDEKSARSDLTDAVRCKRCLSTRPGGTASRPETGMRTAAAREKTADQTSPVPAATPAKHHRSLTDMDEAVGVDSSQTMSRGFGIAGTAGSQVTKASQDQWEVTWRRLESRTEEHYQTERERRWEGERREARDRHPEEDDQRRIQAWMILTCYSRDGEPGFRAAAAAGRERKRVLRAEEHLSTALEQDNAGEETKEAAFGDEDGSWLAAQRIVRLCLGWRIASVFCNGGNARGKNKSNNG